MGATVFAFLADLADLDATDGQGVTGAGRDGEANFEGRCSGSPDRG